MGRRVLALLKGCKYNYFISMVEYLILPGYGNSGAKHWQTHWEKRDPNFIRVEQKAWLQPECIDWVTTLEENLLTRGDSVFLVAHSLACLLVPHWALQASTKCLSKVKGAFLVAVPDPDSSIFPAAAKGFSPLPRVPLPFATLIVASSNDPYGTVEFSRQCARDWGGGIILIGDKGHINTDSGLGQWEEGRILLDSFVF